MKRLMYVLLFVLLTGVSYAQQAKYVFYFIGDGMGVNQVNGTEMYLAEQEGRIGVKPLLFTTFPVGTVATTFSATNSVTLQRPVRLLPPVQRHTMGLSVWTMIKTSCRQLPRKPRSPVRK